MHPAAFLLAVSALIMLTTGARAKDADSTVTGKTDAAKIKEGESAILDATAIDSAPKKDDVKPGADICHPAKPVPPPPIPQPSKAEMEALFKRRPDIKTLKDSIDANRYSKGLVSNAAYMKLEKKIKLDKDEKEGRSGIITLKQFYTNYIDKDTRDPKKRAKIVQWGGYTQAYYKQEELVIDMKRRVLEFGDNTVHIGGLSCAEGFGVFEKFAQEYRKSEGWTNVKIGGIVSSAGLNPEWMENGWNDDLDFGIIIPQLHSNFDNEGNEDWVTRFILQRDLNNPETFTGDIIERAVENASDDDYKAYQLFYQGGEIAYKEGMSMIHKMTADPKKYKYFQMELHSSWEQVNPQELKAQIKAGTCDPKNPPMKQKGAQDLYNTVTAIQKSKYPFTDAGAWEVVLGSDSGKHRDNKKDRMIKAAADWASSHIQICFQMKMAKFDCTNKANRGWAYFLKKCKDCTAKNECWT